MSIEHTCDECGKKEADHCLCEKCLESKESDAYDEGKRDAENAAE